MGARNLRDDSGNVKKSCHRLSEVDAADRFGEALYAPFWAI